MQHFDDKELYYIDRALRMCLVKLVTEGQTAADIKSEALQVFSAIRTKIDCMMVEKFGSKPAGFLDPDTPLKEEVAHQISEPLLAESEPDSEVTHTSHARYVGKLMATIQSVESLLRALLTVKENQSLELLSKIANAKVGDDFPRTKLTEFIPLSNLITTYNDLVRGSGQPLLDREILKYRHVIAHGRLIMDAPVFPARCVNFKQAKARDSTIKLEFNEYLNRKWFCAGISIAENLLQILGNDPDAISAGLGVNLR